MSNIYVALDLETTGLDAERDAITEIGAVKFRGETILETFQTLVNPRRPIPFNIQQLTGITTEMVADAPSLSDVLPRLHRMVGDHPIIGHNVGFDLSFLGRQGLFRDNFSIDTFELASILLPHADRYNLATLAETVGIELPASHRALDDAKVTHALFVSLLGEALRVDLKVIQQINKLAANSNWSLRPVFADVEQTRARSAFTTSLGQQLAAKGALSAATGARGLFGEQETVLDGPPLVPAAQPGPLDVEALCANLEEDGLFSHRLPHFEYRRQQVDMLRLLGDAFNESRHLMVEAGTGIGKSIAYLLPAIYWAVQNGQRVVVATHTINLQDQLLNKDIPDLQRILPVDFRAVSLKGRSNYVCPSRVNQYMDALQVRLRRQPADGSGADLELRVLAKVLVWMATTVTGDKQELFLPTAAENAIWEHLCSESEFCSPTRCRRENCFFHRARQAAEGAHVLVVNHALLLADAAAENRVLPEYSHLIVDEAHHLEDSITNQMSFYADQRSLERLLDDLSQPVNRQRYMGFLTEVHQACRDSLPVQGMAQVEDVIQAGHQNVQETRRHLSVFFQALNGFVAEHGSPRNSPYDFRLRLTGAVRRQQAWDEVEIAWDNLSLGFSEVIDTLANLRRVLEILDDTHGIDEMDDLWNDLSGYRSRLEKAHEQLETIVQIQTSGHGNAVTWLEVSSRTDNISLHSAPLHVGNLMQQHIFNTKDTVILTSATLKTEENTDYLRDRLGAMDVDEASVGSPFDYESSTLLYLPTDIPEPNRPQYQRTLETALIDLVRAVGGRTLVLFTSYSHLRNTSSTLREALVGDGILVLEQGGGGSRTQLLERFRSADKAVLMGTRSFWEGIDVAGPQLSCVVIAKLPFAVPDDPVFSARSEGYEDGFSQYSLPDTILRFRQGFGRLIRNKTDRGVVVCLDRRVLSRRYGQAFLDSLPRCTTLRGPTADLGARAARWINQS